MINYTSKDTYQQKAIITKQRRASQYKASRTLMAQLKAYYAACATAKANGAPQPYLSEFTAEVALRRVEFQARLDAIVAAKKEMK